MDRKHFENANSFTNVRGREWPCVGPLNVFRIRKKGAGDCFLRDPWLTPRSLLEDFGRTPALQPSGVLPLPASIPAALWSTLPALPHGTRTGIPGPASSSLGLPPWRGPLSGWWAVDKPHGPNSGTQCCHRGSAEDGPVSGEFSSYLTGGLHGWEIMYS